MRLALIACSILFVVIPHYPEHLRNVLTDQQKAEIKAGRKEPAER